MSRAFVARGANCIKRFTATRQVSCSQDLARPMTSRPRQQLHCIAVLAATEAVRNKILLVVLLPVVPHKAVAEVSKIGNL